MFRISAKRVTNVVANCRTAYPVYNVGRFSTYKTSTGLAGLAVDPNGRETLLSLSSEILSSVQKIPASSQYRVDVEKWFTYITKVAKENEQIIDIEREIDMGQIEEVISMAKDEIKLIEYYYDNKGWELVAEAQAGAAELVEEMADSIYFSSPASREGAVSAEE